LQGFEKIMLNPGEKKNVVFKLKPEQLSFLDENLKWVIKPGTFAVMAGSSSKDIRLKGEFIVK
jgi:beta-glucosidase